MKIAFISTYDRTGGAAQSAWRTANALDAIGLEVSVISKEVRGPHPLVVPVNPGLWKYYSDFLEYYERLRFVLLEASKKVRFRFSLSDIGQNIAEIKEIQEADIIHFHWVHKGFISIKSLEAVAKLNKPVVWSLHDMWAFTGGCHYVGECVGFQSTCGNCPLLKRPSPYDLSHKIWTAKKFFYESVNWNFVTSSEWLRRVAKESSLLADFKVKAIPTPVETDIFRPEDKFKIRKALNLPTDKKLILFVAMNINDERKGLRYLLEALRMWNTEKPWAKDEYELLVLGKVKENLGEIPFKVHRLGFLSEPSKIAAAYNAADVFMMPSLEDNLPNTVLESLACGVPVVAFDTGGIPEMVEHKKSGYIAERLSASDLVKGIKWVFDSNLSELSDNARKRAVEKYSYEIVAEQYKELYSNLLSNEPLID